MSRWVEHYLDIYSRENSVHPRSAWQHWKPACSWRAGLWTHSGGAQQSHRRPGEWKRPLVKVGSPPEVIKCRQTCTTGAASRTPVPVLERRQGASRTYVMPRSLPCTKNKGDRSDCNNYRGISLPSIIGKVFTRVVLVRLQVLAEHIYPESQCSLRSERSTVDMIFSIWQLQEKCCGQQMPLYIVFMDLTKAFDLVSRQGLFQLLKKIGCVPPPSCTAALLPFTRTCRVLWAFDGETSEPFRIWSEG